MGGRQEGRKVSWQGEVPTSREERCGQVGGLVAGAGSGFGCSTSPPPTNTHTSRGV